MARPALPLALLVLAACGNDSKVGTYNVAPTVSISSPTEGSVFNEGETVSFQALVNDDQTRPADLFLEWTSEPGGLLSEDVHPDDNGNVTFSTAELPVGNLVVRLTATDAMAEQGFGEVSVSIQDLPDAPTISVLHPGTGEGGTEGEDFRFVVQVSDQQNSPDQLSISFESDIDGEFCTPTADPTGYAECNYALSGGDHALVLSVTDLDQLRTEETVYFAVLGTGEIDDDGDGFSEEDGDCNDNDGSVNPSADELYNNRDDDCDDRIDEGTEGYDDDGDGYSEVQNDCNDAYSGTYPTAAEVCDGQDNDCDGTTDENTSCFDDDGDGFTENDGDCDDSLTVTYPGAPEAEDGNDNDCDGIVDEGTRAYDDDGDGYSENAGDCNDASASVSPGVVESCDGADNDCDGTVDEQNASGCTTYYYDADRDGYGSSTGACLCAPSGGYDSRYGTDCYDSNASANPSATAWYTSPRGDRSYDYNCDGTESHYYGSATYSCSNYVVYCDVAEGWDGGDPGCGGSGTWVYDCHTQVFSCYTDSETRTQSCH